MTLEQSLRDLCEKHDFDTIQISLNVKYGWAAVVHWDGSCATGTYGKNTTLETTIVSAITNAYAQRAAALVVTLPDAPLLVEA